MPRGKLNNISIFGILDLLIGISGLLLLLIGSISTHSFLAANSTFSLILDIYSWLISIALVVIGIGLLKNKKLAKKSMMYASIIVLAVSLINGLVQGSAVVTSANYLLTVPSLLYSFIMIGIYYGFALWYFATNKN